MRLAVQQLVRVHAAANCFTCTTQRLEKQKPVGIQERRGFVSVRQETLSLCDPFREVRCLNLDASHRSMQAMERIGILGR